MYLCDKSALTHELAGRVARGKSPEEALATKHFFVNDVIIWPVLKKKYHLSKEKRVRYMRGRLKWGTREG